MLSTTSSKHKKNGIRDNKRLWGGDSKNIKKTNTAEDHRLEVCQKLLSLTVCSTNEVVKNMRIFAGFRLNFSAPFGGEKMGYMGYIFSHKPSLRGEAWFVSQTVNGDPVMLGCRVDLHIIVYKQAIC